jgi:hypothetical protein
MDRSRVVADVYPGGPADDASGRLLDWLALYLPSWGSSVVLHAAVFVLAAFLAWQGGQEPPWIKGHGQVVRIPQHQVQQPRTTLESIESHGRKEPRPSTFRWQETPNPFAGLARNRLNEVPIIGVGQNPNGWGLGEPEGWDSIGGRPLFPIPVEGANKIVYVVDRSGSMTDSIGRVKYELKRCIRELGPDKQFHVIFYSSGPPLEMPARRLVTATEAEKQRAFAFIDGIVAQGETDPTDALRRAFAVGPDAIYLLTDGEFDRAVVDQVKQANPAGKVSVHTIAFLYEAGVKVLKEIAAQNRGNFKFVSAEDLAALEP